MGLFNDSNPQRRTHRCELGWRVTEAAEAAGVARQTAYKWLARHDAEKLMSFFRISEPTVLRLEAAS